MNAADRNKPLRQYLREHGVAESVANHPTTVLLTEGKVRRKLKPTAKARKKLATKNMMKVETHVW